MQSRRIASLLLTVLLFISGPTIGEAKTIPKEFKQCKLNYPKFDDCMQEAVQSAFVAMKNGIPAYQLPPIDPLAVTHMRLEHPISAKIDFSNIKMFGLSSIKVHSVKTDTKNRQIEMKLFSDEYNIEGDYEVDGKFKSLALKGKGKAKLTLSGVQSVLSLKADGVTAADGNVYWNVTVVTVKITEVVKFKVHFYNLFDGDKTLEEKTNKVLNDNWEELWAEIGPDLEEGFADVYKVLANILFREIPEKIIFAPSTRPS